MSFFIFEQIRATVPVGSRVTILLQNGPEKAGVVVGYGPETITLRTSANKQVMLHAALVMGCELDSADDAPPPVEPWAPPPRQYSPPPYSPPPVEPRTDPTPRNDPHTNGSAHDHPAEVKPSVPPVVVVTSNPPPPPEVPAPPPPPVTPDVRSDPDYHPMIESVARCEGVSTTAELRPGPLVDKFPRDTFGGFVHQQEALKHWDWIQQKLTTAEQLRDMGRLGQIVQRAAEFVAKFPVNAHARYLHATLLARHGQYPQAVAEFEQASAFGYGPDADRGAAHSALQSGDPLRAAWWLIRYIAKRTDDTDAPPLHVFLRLIEGEKAYHAWTDLLSAVTVADTHPHTVAWMFTGLAFCLKRNDHPDGALTAFRLGRQSPPLSGSRLTDAVRPLLDVLVPLGSPTAWAELRSRLSADERRKQKAEEEEAWAERQVQMEKQAGLRPNGEVIFYQRHKQFGKIRAQSGVELFFHLNYVADDDLKGQLEWGAEHGPIPVSFSEGQGQYGQPIAQHVRQAGTPEQIVGRAEALAKQGRQTEALLMLDRLARAGWLPPELEARAATVRDAKWDKGNVHAPRKAGTALDQAREASQRKEFEVAEGLYREAIRKRVGHEAAVKDLAMMLQQWKKPEEAVQLMREHDLEGFAEPIPALNVLATILEHSNRNAEAIPVLEKVRQHAAPADHVRIDKRLAFNQFRAKDYQAAEATLQKVLKRTPGDEATQRWYDALQVAKRTQNYDALVGLPSLVGLEVELSPVLRFDLDRCKEFVGLTAADLSATLRGEVTEEMFQRYDREIDKLSGRKGIHRPRERAQHYLTGAKLLEMIGSEDQEKMRHYLRNYCAAMGDAAAADQKPLDVLRTYYAETFTVEQVWGPQLSVKAAQFLLSYIPNVTYDTVLEKNVPTIAEAIERLSHTGPAGGFWHGLLNLFVSNRAAAENILPVIFQNPAARVQAGVFLTQQGVDGAAAVGSKTAFVQVWEAVRVDRSRELTRWVEGLLSLLDERITDLAVEHMVQMTGDARREWLCPMDVERLKTVRGVLVDHLGPFALSADTFEGKEWRLKQAQAQLVELGRKIVEAPTRPAIEVLHRLVEHLRECCQQSYEDLLVQCTPVVEVDLPIKQMVPSDDGEVLLSVRVINQPNSSPITDVRLTITPTAEFAPSQPTFTHLEWVRGGTAAMIPCRLRLAPESRDLPMLTVAVTLEYKDRSDNVVLRPGVREEPIHLYLRLQAGAEFVDFPNPFAEFAQGGPVFNPDMFKGRWQFIDRIVETLRTSQAKCYVFHGQKRVGKSSILHHLNEKLTATGEFLCAGFTIAGLASTITEAMLVFEMLNAVHEALDRHAWEYPQVPVPVFTCPTRQAVLQDPNPAALLREQVREFLKGCRRTPGWEGRRLLFLIDEFTYLYDAILAHDSAPTGGLPPAFMKFWKGLTEQRLFSAVLVGQDTMPRFFDRFRNELISHQPERLTYLDRPDARELIEEPVRMPGTGESRYLGRAVDRIIDLTAGNPYYIQIFCNKLVERMRLVWKLSQATEVEVDDITRDLIEDSNHKLGINTFDNLLAAGNFELEKTEVAQNWAVLYAIALNSRGGGSAVKNCPPDDLYAAPTLVHLGRAVIEQRLKDLEERLVLERPPQQPDTYRIRVRLFRDWLLHHPPFPHHPRGGDT